MPYINNLAVDYWISLSTGSTSAVLQYTGTGASASNRNIGINGHGTLSTGSAAGTLNLSGSVYLVNGGARTLTLDGANTGANAISGPISDSGTNVLSIVKKGTGVWGLTGSNSYSGTTAINAGTLQINGANSLGDPTVTGTVVLGNATLESIANTYDLGVNRTIALTGPATLQSDSGAMTISGNVLANSYSLTVAGAGKTVLSGAIIGSDGLIKNGTGTLTLSASNMYSGATTINSGTVQISDPSHLGDSTQVTNTITLGNAALEVTANSFDLGANRTIALVGSGTLQSDAGTLSVSAAISGSGNLAIGGSGTVILAGSNSIGGTVAVNGGTLVLGNPNAINTTPGAENAIFFGAGSAGILNMGGMSWSVPSLNTNATPGAPAVKGGGTGSVTLTIGNSSNLSSIFTGSIQDGSGGGSLSLIKTGTGTLILNGSSSYTGSTTVNAGTLQLGDGTAAHDTALATSSLANNGVLVFNTGGTQTANYAISGAGSVSKNGVGMLALGGSSTFASPMVVINGTVSAASIGNAGSPGNLGAAAQGWDGTAPIQLTSNGAKTLRYTGGGETTDRNIYINQQIGHVAAIDASGSGPLVLSGSIDSYAGNSSGGCSYFLLGGSNTGDNTLSGNLTDNNRTEIQKVDAGTWALVGNRNYSGITDVQGGVLKFDSIANAGVASALGRASQFYNGSTPVVYAIALGSATTSGTLQYTGTGAGSSNRGIGLNGNGTLSTGTAAGTLALSGTVMGSATGAKVFTVDGASNGNNTLSGPIRDGTSTLSVVKAGAGLWILSGSNSYSGSTAVNSGTLRLGNANALGTGALSANGGTLDLAGYSSRVSALSGSAGLITNSVSGTATLTASVASGTSTFNGTIADGAGSVVLTQTGAGTLILGGSLRMAGLNVNAGSTQIQQSGSIGALNVANAAGVALAAHTGSGVTTLDLSSLTLSGSPAFTALNSDTLDNQAAAAQLSSAGEAPAETASFEAVPEPATTGLIAIGIAGTLGMIRRRRHVGGSR